MFYSAADAAHSLLDLGFVLIHRSIGLHEQLVRRHGAACLHGIAHCDGDGILFLRIPLRAQPPERFDCCLHSLLIRRSRNDREKGTVDIIFQIVGGTTMELNSLEVGQSVHDFVGPLGRATEVEGLKKVCVVGGGVGCAIALPIARELHEQGCVVHSVVGFRSKDLLILEDEFKACSDELRIMTDDGSYGTKGVVTAALDELVAAGNQYDLVITIGPLIMMKFVVKTCQKHGLKSIVSMNPIMIDGTGMCGGCRLTVGGETKFACVDGPDFDGDLVDFDEAMARGTMYRPFEAKAREKACNLFKTQEGM